MRLIRFLRKHLTYRLVCVFFIFLLIVLSIIKIPISIQGEELDRSGLLNVMAIIASVLGGVMLLTGSSKPIFGIAETRKPEESLILKDRKFLLEAVDKVWLSGLLDHLLNQQRSLAIDLRFLEPDKVAKRVGKEPYPLTDNNIQALLKIFDDFGRKVVILGEPGAGKTVLLLQLARTLWHVARSDENKRIPMVFPLASWAAKRLTFNLWLQNELKERYGVPAKLAETLVGSEQLIYLLDGLDEVADDAREECLQALKDFTEDTNRHVEYVFAVAVSSLRH